MCVPPRVDILYVPEYILFTQKKVTSQLIWVVPRNPLMTSQIVENELDVRDYMKR
jgi:hypothetical protein